MSKDEKCTCKACKNAVFHCQICKFVGFLLPSSSCLLKLPSYWYQTLMFHFPLTQLHILFRNWPTPKQPRTMRFKELNWLEVNTSLFGNSGKLISGLFSWWLMRQYDMISTWMARTTCQKMSGVMVLPDKSSSWIRTIKRRPRLTMPSMFISSMWGVQEDPHTFREE